MNFTEKQIDIIENYKNSFVEEYDEWLQIISTINKSLYEYLDMFDEKDIDLNFLRPFTYNEFCSAYIVQVERYFEDFETLNKDGINAIFEVMILLRISNTSTTPSTVIEKFLL